MFTRYSGIMKIALIHANSTTRPYRVAPLGLAFVATWLKANNHEVEVFETPFGGNEEFRLLARVRSFSPDLIALGVRNLDNSDLNAYESYLDLPSRLIREFRKEHLAKIIIGGSAATVDPLKVLSICHADHILLGEGESALGAFLQAYQNGSELPPVFQTVDGEPFRVQDTLALGAPRLYDYINLKAYKNSEAGYPLQTKRGCPLKCTYCTYARIEGSRYRLLSPSAVADEIEGAIDKGVRDFEFVDSTFNLPIRHAHAVLDEIIRRQLKVNFVGTGLNPLHLPLDFLQKMVHAGFRTAILTAESASETMLKSYDKGFSVQALAQAADRLSKVNLQAMWVFLLGGVGESRATVEETLAFISESVPVHHTAYITSGIRIYPGAPIHRQLLKGELNPESIQSNDTGVDFYLSHLLDPEWLRKRLNEFQRGQPNVMLSSEGHSFVTALAQKILGLAGVSKPYWRFLPQLNRIKNFLPGG